MAPKAWYALVTFVAETPDDEIEADELADQLSASLEKIFPALGPVSYARVEDLTTYDENGWEPYCRLVPLND